MTPDVTLVDMAWDFLTLYLKLEAVMLPVYLLFCFIVDR